MRLTAAQLNWLGVAQLAGYARGFVHAPTPTLRRLEELKLIERNPTTTGKRTLWRVTMTGQQTPTGPHAQNQRT